VTAITQGMHYITRHCCKRFTAAVLVRYRVASATNRISLCSGGLALVGTGFGHAFTQGRCAGTCIRDTALGLVASTPLVC
jgi:hypothetical protein